MALSDLFFWTGARNRTGLPNITGPELAALIQAAGQGPHAGQGALITLSGGTLIPDAAPPTAFGWFGATVVYDDLAFFDGATAFIIPDLDPPIRRVRFWGNVVWPPATGARTSFEAVNGIPVPGTGTVVLPETGSGVVGFSNDLISNPIPVVAGDALDLFGAQLSGGPLVISVQEMGIEVVN